MRRSLLIVMSSLLASGCVSRGRPSSPAIDAVAVPVPVACMPRTPPAPNYPDTDAALASARDIYAGVQLLMAGRSLRQMRETELEAALRVCSG